ncbi:leucine-rich repeat domain-containing protein [Bacillus timonensis]|nr:leucine-rich repeat domain-containing protein [Bacillus timonensis]
MKKFKFFNVLLVLSLLVSLLLPVSTVEAAKKATSMNVSSDTYCTDDVYGPGDDTYDPAGDTYGPGDDTYSGIEIHFKNATEQSITIQWDYYDWSEDLSYNLYIDGEKLTTLEKYDYEYTFKNLAPETAYTLEVEVLKSGEPTGDFVVVTYETTSLPSGDIVTIEDPALEELVKVELAVTDRELFESDLSRLEYLYAGWKGITSLSGLEFATNLEFLSLDGNNVSDLSPLENLNNLSTLFLYSNEVSDIQSLSKIPNLTHIELTNNLVTDISPLANLTNLHTVYLDNNQVSDISFLSGMESLMVIGLSNTNITNIDALKTIPYLESVNLWDVELNDDAKTVIDELRRNGVWVSSPHVTINTGWFDFGCGNIVYFDENGELFSGWLTEGEETYYFSEANDESFGLMVTGWTMIDNTWYFFAEDGAMKTGWVKDGASWYYLNSDGQMQSGWVKDGTTWYYLNADGQMQSGWIKNNGSWYYLASSGAMKTGWLKDGQSWYFLTDSGAMKTGWLKSGNDWYHLQTSGSMSTGWKKINNEWYYFYNEGKMAANTTIQGYKLGKSGAWIR